MWTRWNDYDSAFVALDNLRHRMEQMFNHNDSFRFGRNRVEGAFNLQLFDTGTAFVVRADVPGMTEKDLQINASQDGLTVVGQRNVEVPEGYSVHRRERAPLKFSRSVTFPVKVDLEKCSATVKNGVLTISLEKAPESQPRRINISTR